jgi:hypothetical protein
VLPLQVGAGYALFLRKEPIANKAIIPDIRDFYFEYV